MRQDPPCAVPSHEDHHHRSQRPDRQPKLVERLRARGDDVTTLSRNPSSAGAVAWQPEDEPAPAAALAGRDAVVHLAGENVAQRWSDDAKRRIRSSRELGTRNLVAGIEAADPRPRVLVSSSAVGYYGPHGDERLDEQTRRPATTSSPRSA